MLNSLARSIALPLLLAGCFVSCSKDNDAPENLSNLENSNLDESLDSGDTNPITVKDQTSSEIDSTPAKQEEVNPQSATQPRGTRDKTEEVVPVKGVEERRSSESALAKGDINFDDLKFDLEKDAPFDPKLITDELKFLDGRDVTLRGYILPSTLFSETNISQFVLVRDNQECCFGPGAALYDCVMIQMVEGNTTDFVTRPVTVAGRFVIDTESYRYPPGLSPNGATHMAVFRIEGLKVE
ncbi:MAG: DUF3299 domain-containing protein [Rubripirellula sp.]